MGRTWHLFRARILQVRRGGWPVASLGFHAVLGAVMAGLVRDALHPYPFALCALTLGALLTALPLLSDLGAILRQDEGADWIGALPATGIERGLARIGHLLVLLGLVTLAWYLPWSLLAPTGVSLPARLTLPLLGFALALTLAAPLIWIQQGLVARVEPLLVLVETLLVLAIVVAFTQLLGHLPELATVGPGAGAGWLPPAWFARPLFDGSATPLVCVATAAALFALAFVPIEEAPRARRRGPVELLLEPIRRLMLRGVRRAERGTFELVFRALPREREVALRTYPMLGIPLAFLWASVRRSEPAGDPWRGDLLALLLFTAPIALPLLLVHVPLTESRGADWLLRMAPRTGAELHGGARKAVLARWVVPLYLGLLALGLLLGEPGLLARLWLAAVALTAILLRLLYPRCVKDLPLSRSPEDLPGGLDWMGLVVPLAVGLTLLAVVANRMVGLAGGIAAALLLLGLEIGMDRRKA